jgi:nitrite reductase/ring-hydroxylating ferredoxin subunit
VVHLASASTTIGLYFASWRVRAGGGSGRMLALAGSAALGATGYLGGHLSYAYGVGVETTAFEAGPQDWTRVAADGDLIEGELTQVRSDGVAILLVRRGGQVYALADRCTHRGGPLSDGDLDGGCVTCPWHGSVFDLRDGSVVRGPATLPQPPYEVKVSDGQVLVRRTEQRSLRTNPI